MDRRINRRQALAGFGSLSLGAVLAACGGGSDDPEPSADEFDGAASCEATAELTEGPYYFDADAVRSDIREDRPGVTLRLGVRVRSSGSCEPIKDAVVDIWHCDAGGVYSGFEARSQGGDGGGPPGGGGQSSRSDDERYLRGTQVTNAEGVAEFTTIYPGWYRGRTVHIHAKVHLDRQTVLTTQLFFDEAVSDAVYAREPYSGHGGRDMTNDQDGIFDPALVMTVKPEGDGYRGLMTFDVSA
jgi:protocatechuate 3,4-dioxygenase beta subunit